MVVEHGTLHGAAAVRMHELLPELLRVVRWRRRRRQAVRGGVGIAASLLLAVFAWSQWQMEPVVMPGPQANSWTTIATDAAVMARCEVGTVERSEWYIDDDGLQACLRAAQRSSGIVRLPGRLVVPPEAIDPFPEPQS